MKKVILAVMLLGSIKAVKSQVIDTTIKEYYAAKIKPIVYKHGFPVVTDTLQWIGFFNVDVVGKDSAVVNFFIKSKSQQNIIFDKYSLSKEEFLDWIDEKSLLVYLRDYLTKVFQKVEFIN